MLTTGLKILNFSTDIILYINVTRLLVAIYMPNLRLGLIEPSDLGSGKKKGHRNIFLKNKNTNKAIKIQAIKK